MATCKRALLRGAPFSLPKARFHRRQGCVPRPSTFGGIAYQDPRFLARRPLLQRFVTRMGSLGTRLKIARVESLLQHSTDLGFLENEEGGTSYRVPRPLIFGRNPYQDPLFLANNLGFGVFVSKTGGLGTRQTPQRNLMNFCST